MSVSQDVRPARTLLLTRNRLISIAMVSVAPAITAVMSVMFYREVRVPMLVTSLVCAIVIDRIVNRITRSYRRRLRAAHELLETRVRERTAELERANHELMVRDRMATAGMLAAGVSHEIRSPLSVIRICVDDIGDELATAPGHVREQIRDISDAAQRIEVILRDLSSLAKPADDPIAPTDVRAVIDSAARLAAYRLGKGVTLERAPCDVPKVHGNNSRLVQVVLNLLINAARASRPDAPNKIVVGAALRGNRVVISIADSGTGMSEETKAKLFQPFFTTGKHSGGTGLGLVICRSIVERMGGAIDITSTLGDGTTVEVALEIS
jgi:two-component system NtrC family sensor kinase